MTRLISTLAAATLVVFSPALASAQAGEDLGVVGETLVKVDTPDGPRWLHLGAEVEIIDVTEGEAVRFNYEDGTIDAIEVTPEGTPVENSGDTAAQTIGEPAPNVGDNPGTGSDAASPEPGTVANVIVRIDTEDGPRWFQLGSDVRAIDVSEGKTVRFSYEGDSIDAIEVTPETAPSSSGN